MRSSWNTWKTLVAVAAGLWLAPQLATASSDFEEQLQAMQERMGQLEDKLQVQTDQLSAAERRVADQEKLIQASGVSQDATGSALSRFLEMTEFGGNVAASYNYNFNNPGSSSGRVNTGGGGNLGVLAGTTAPHHPKANTFQLDQLLFTMENPSTAESRAGFRVDLAYGISADALRGGGVDGSPSFLYQAYVSYLIGGVEIDAGRFETIVGAEVFQVDQNFNITRGLVYGLQPTSHTGVLLSCDCGEGVSWAIGVANDTRTNTMADLDNDKEFLAQIAWSGETSSLSTSVIVGDAGVPGTSRDDQTLLDILATWDPSDQLSIWANFDYIWLQDDTVATGTIGNLWGLAVASRYGVTDSTGVAVRGEVVSGGKVDRAKVWSLTGTIDHALTDHLMALVEVRYDRGSATGSNDGFTNTNGTIARQSQVLGLAQLVYSF